jgi:hypothetical protein
LTFMQAHSRDVMMYLDRRYIQVRTKVYE